MTAMSILYKKKLPIKAQYGWLSDMVANKVSEKILTKPVNTSVANKQLQDHGIVEQQLSPRYQFKNILKNTVRSDAGYYGYSGEGNVNKDGDIVSSASVSSILSPIKFVAEDIMSGKKRFAKEDPRSYEDPTNRDILNAYFGFPVENKESTNLAISGYSPSTSNDKTALYYRLKDDENIFSNIGEYPFDAKSGKASAYSGPLGNFTIAKGSDQKGKYISYYDKWDLHPIGGSGAWNPANLLETLGLADDQSMGIGKPLEFYNRRYYKENPNGTISWIDDKGNIYGNEISLQSGLSVKGKDLSILKAIKTGGKEGLNIIPGETIPTFDSYLKLAKRKNPELNINDQKVVAELADRYRSLTTAAGTSYADAIRNYALKQ